MDSNPFPKPAKLTATEAQVIYDMLKQTLPDPENTFAAFGRLSYSNAGPKIGNIAYKAYDYDGELFTVTHGDITADPPGNIQIVCEELTGRCMGYKKEVCAEDLLRTISGDTFGNWFKDVTIEWLH